MFKKNTPSEIKPLEQLNLELEKINERIRRQQASNSRGGGIIPPHMGNKILENYKKEQEAIKKQIELHPESNNSNSNQKIV